MAGAYEATIKPSYRFLRSLYLGVAAQKDKDLPHGAVTVLIANDDEFSVEAKLNSQGLLSGVSKLYAKLPLNDGTKVKFQIQADGSLLITSPTPTTPAAPATSAIVSAAGTASSPPRAAAEPKTVFAAQALNHIHIEPFRPESLDNWEPENETDVYLAFGVLQEFTDYQYCCATSISLLRKLGAKYSAATKPDAIVIDRRTDQYLMAEWKKYSADFKLNHKPEDVDLLVCWDDNEPDKTGLPRQVVILHNVARQALQAKLGPE